MHDFDACSKRPLLYFLMYCNAVPVGLISDPSGGQQQTLFIEVGDSPGTMLIRIVPEQGIPRYVVIYLDPSSPSTFVEVIRATTAGVSDWVIDVPQGGLYSVQVRVGDVGGNRERRWSVDMHCYYCM